MNIKNKISVGLLTSLLGASAWAHTGHAGHEVNSFLSGFLHPVGGVDHLLAMVAVGLWSAMIWQGKRQWLGPLVFMAAMVVGALIGTQYTVMGTELMIALSLAGLGGLLVLLWGERQKPNHHQAAALGVAFVAMSAVFHGVAHGNEMPLGQSLWAYGVGFVLMTLGLHVLGVMCSRYWLRVQPLMLRVLGAVIGRSGIMLLWQPL